MYIWTRVSYIEGYLKDLFGLVVEYEGDDLSIKLGVQVKYI